MKKIALLITLLVLFAAFAGCAPKPAPAPPETASGNPQTPVQTGSTPPDAQTPNVWVVAREAPVMDADTGKQAGTAYPGFAIALANEKDGKAMFSIAFLDEKGENVKTVKNYAIETSSMEKKYVEPQAVIEIISADMIKVKPNGVFYNDKDERLLNFTEEIGPFRYIQKTDKGYMLAIDSNVVFIREQDAEFIPIAVQ